MPGFIDIEKGVIVGTHNLLGFDNFPMRDDLSRRLKPPSSSKTTQMLPRWAKNGWVRAGM